jgi:hypothetical protein
MAWFQPVSGCSTDMADDDDDDDFCERKKAACCVLLPVPATARCDQTGLESLQTPLSACVQCPPVTQPDKTVQGSSKLLGPGLPCSLPSENANNFGNMAS